MKLETINKFLNVFLICLVVHQDKEMVTTLRIGTIFKHGAVKFWPHIKLLDRLGF